MNSKEHNLKTKINGNSHYHPMGYFTDDNTRITKEVLIEVDSIANLFQKEGVDVNLLYKSIKDFAKSNNVSIADIIGETETFNTVQFENQNKVLRELIAVLRYENNLLKRG